jgi:hypothetical protein
MKMQVKPEPQTAKVELPVRGNRAELAPYLNFFEQLKANDILESREVKVLDEATGNLFTMTVACAPHKDVVLPDMYSPGAPHRPCPQCHGAGYLVGQ